jgi:hypothetical protein
LRTSQNITRGVHDFEELAGDLELAQVLEIWLHAELSHDGPRHLQEFAIQLNVDFVR